MTPRIVPVDEDVAEPVRTVFFVAHRRPGGGDVGHGLGEG